MILARATFGDQLRRWREEAGLSQVDLATELKVKQQTVSDWERDRGLPHRTRVTALEQALRLDPQVVLLALHSAASESDEVEEEPADLDGILPQLTSDERRQVRGYIDALIEGRRPRP